MYLSCLPVSFFGDLRSGVMTMGQWAGMARSLNLDGIDISVILLKSFDDGYLKQVRREIESSGPGLAMIAGYTDFTHPDAQVREKEAEQLRRLIAVASLLGARYIRVTAGQHYPEVDRNEAIDWAVAGLTSCLAIARAQGVRLVYENHSKPVVWDRFDFSYPTENFLAIAKATRGTDLGILFDTANTLAFGDDPLPVLEEVVARVEFVHAADIAEKGALKHVALGTGVVPFREIFAHLKRSGYDGWVSVEEASRTGTSGMVNAVRFVREAWTQA